MEAAPLRAPFSFVVFGRQMALDRKRSGCSAPLLLPLKGGEEHWQIASLGMTDHSAEALPSLGGGLGGGIAAVMNPGFARTWIQRA